ncbi:uncharacterized protein EI90DRAFT_2343816 [Cantharellus anzutake]|uniref:uncharacterized protein n=1 Tax=Cantharellus anzutake TaxID=1750568 RepID=UPI0019085A1E|nr:uncharacterized protein EI90DRAFT_2343816 [Cantharellus anzutake]KAF8324241.1 hypothetical protein EI90DRAFT_2343816 [Cantharellus anzutake]
MLLLRYLSNPEHEATETQGKNIPQSAVASFPSFFRTTTTRHFHVQTCLTKITISRAVQDLVRISTLSHFYLLTSWLSRQHPSRTTTRAILSSPRATTTRRMSPFCDRTSVYRLDSSDVSIRDTTHSNHRRLISPVLTNLKCAFFACCKTLT